MSIKKAAKSSVTQWVDALIAKQCVYGPVAKWKDTRFSFEQLADAAELRLDYDVSILAPKKFLQPQSEVLLTFNDKNEYAPVKGPDPFVILGVHPYDLAAINQMDVVHTKDNVDGHYVARREAATIVALDVQNPSPNVFAACMGTAVAKDGFDILLTLVGDSYVVDARTAKGEALLADLPHAEEADAVSLARREQVWEDAQRFLKKHVLECDHTDLPEVLEKSYSSEVWAKNADKCHSCGSCTLVCPTCYCFDVQDDVDWSLANGERVRKWDGCLLTNFATVAGDHNFRKQRAERYRHRFYRKGKYLYDRMGSIACVGCGRCVTACTTDIANPVDVYNTLVEDL
jgi:ferredoxin